MDDTPTLLDFIKAVSNADRLRIIGLLTQQPASIRTVAEQLGMPFREAFNHLAFLEFAGAVRKSGDLFSVDNAAVDQLSRRQFAGSQQDYVPAPDIDAQSRKVLAAYLNADGSLKQIPAQPAKLRVILYYLVTTFEPGAAYTEKEVNTLLRRFHADTAALRRALIDEGLLGRVSDGSRYWRISPSQDRPV